MANQKINCDVESCKFQDDTDCKCTLDEIKVGCECGSKEVEKETATVCRSFECDNNKLEKEEK